MVEKKFGRIAFVSAMLVGFFTHSFIFYNKISYLDDCTYYFGLGATWTSGRWGLGVIAKLQRMLDLQTYSMPIFNGMLTIFFLAVAAALVTKMLRVKNQWDAIAIGSYMVVFPAVTSTFAYMFTAPYYYFSVLLMVAAVYLVHKSKYGAFLAIAMIAFGMGIYQANVGVATALFVLVLLRESREYAFAQNRKVTIRCFLSLVLGIIGYFVCNKFFLYWKGMELSNYQGINGMTSVSVRGLLEGVANAYKLWPRLMRWELFGISNSMLIRGMYAISLILFLGLSLVRLYQVYQEKDAWKLVYNIALLISVPLALGIIYVMTTSSSVNIHTLMIYNIVFLPFYSLVLLRDVEGKGKEFVHKAVLITIVIMSIYYIGLDNCAYLKATYQQENAIAYSQMLISRIKSVDNYSDQFPVLVLGIAEGEDSSIAYESEFNKIKIQGFHTNLYQFIAYYANPRFWELHCGYRIYEPKNPEKYYESKDVEKMPCYPKDGSIQVIDDVVVVKLSNLY